MIHLHEALQRYFGYTEFRTGQKEIIQDLLQRQNVLAMLPTGTGKSLCYQLPALLLPGSAIIVSPLISLMEDQVQQLKCIGIKNVAALNSFLTLEQKEQIIKRLPKCKLIYVSPEMLQAKSVKRALKKLTVSLFVVDEAHCISQWGHDFRTDYLKLHEVIKELNSPPCLAITATATKRVQDDIIAQLRLKNVKKRIYSVDRPNIAIRVIKTATTMEKEQLVVELVKQLHGTGLIYFLSRKWAEDMTAKLKRSGIHHVAYYHGGMETEERILIQKQFFAGKLNILCCTNAFGMGINKSDIRYVIHFHPPTDLESYLQEIGRAGRDGKESIAVLLHTDEDERLSAKLIEKDLPEPAEIRRVLFLLNEACNKSLRFTMAFEEKLLNIARLEEIKWRFLRYHFVEKGIIVNDGLIKPFDEKKLFNEILAIVEERRKIKRRQLYRMNRWLMTESCRRNAYLAYFAKKKDNGIKQCCDICGLKMERYFQSQEKQGPIPIETEPLEWQPRLRRLFHQNIHKEMEGCR